MSNLYNLKRGVATIGDLANTWDSATFTIGDEETNSINVGIQLTDFRGDDVSQSFIVQGYLSDASTGLGLTATAPDGNIAIGTDGAIFGELVTDKVFLIESEADGSIDLDIGEASTGTWYLVLVTPTGAKVVSDAITFA